MTKLSGEDTMDITEDDINRMKEHVMSIPDPRRERGNLRHKLADMLLTALYTVIIGEDEFEAMEEGALEMEWYYPRCVRVQLRGCFPALVSYNNEPFPKSGWFRESFF
ncbi:MAG: transposase family protein [Treponema sp.]|jgi:hypothetical protein|nr:transposase family protein [Treponema sp.]